MILIGENQSTQRKPGRSATLTTENTNSYVLGSNLSLNGKRPFAKMLSLMLSVDEIRDSFYVFGCPR